jgi:hypothetical protein
MKFICARAKASARSRKTITVLLEKHPELFRKQPRSYSYVDHNEWEDGQATVDIEVRDESTVEQIAAELRFCGWRVNVMTEVEYEAMQMGEAEGSA